MPARANKIETRLTVADQARFEQLARLKDCTRTELAREAILFYLDHVDADNDAVRNAERDKLIVDALKRMENRFASLMVRLGIDVETMYGYLWTTADRAKREKIFQEARATGVYRFKKKLEAMEVEFKSQLAKQPDKLK